VGLSATRVDLLTGVKAAAGLKVLGLPFFTCSIIITSHSNKTKKQKRREDPLKHISKCTYIDEN
jgi:hypothetical protein